MITEKNVCALQASLYLVICFSDTRHCEQVRLAGAWNRVR